MLILFYLPIRLLHILLTKNVVHEAAASIHTSACDSHVHWGEEYIASNVLKTTLPFSKCLEFIDCATFQVFKILPSYSHMDIMCLNPIHPIPSPSTPEQYLSVINSYELGLHAQNLPFKKKNSRLSIFSLSLKTLLCLRSCGYHVIFFLEHLVFLFACCSCTWSPTVKGELWHSILFSHMDNRWPWASHWLVHPFSPDM